MSYKYLLSKYLIKYCWLSLSRPRLSRITANLEAKIWSLLKHENLEKGIKYCGKEEKLLLRRNFSSFPQYFQYISNLGVELHIHLFNMVGRLIASSILQFGYVEVWISRSISQSLGIRDNESRLYSKWRRQYSQSWNYKLQNVSYLLSDLIKFMPIHQALHLLCFQHLSESFFFFFFFFFFFAQHLT